MACRGLSLACSALETPVTGGNVSLYNETRLPDGSLQPIHPTPVVGMVGLVHDLERICGLAWRSAGDVLWLLGVPLEEVDDPRVSLAGSSYLERLHGAVTGRPPEIDLPLERTVQAFLRQAIATGLVASATTSATAAWRWRRRNAALPAGSAPPSPCRPAGRGPIGSCSPKAGRACWSASPRPRRRPGSRPSSRPPRPVLRFPPVRWES